MQNKKEDVIITIDVREVLSGADKGGITLPPRGECGPADFEDWTVTDELGKDMCILGETHTFKRMKRTPGDTGCFLKKDYVFAPYASNVRARLSCQGACTRACSPCETLAQSCSASGRRRLGAHIACTLRASRRVCRPEYTESSPHAAAARAGV